MKKRLTKYSTLFWSFDETSAVQEQRVSHIQIQYIGLYNDLATGARSEFGIHRKVPKETGNAHKMRRVFVNQTSSVSQSGYRRIGEMSITFMCISHPGSEVTLPEIITGESIFDE